MSPIGLLIAMAAVATMGEVTAFQSGSKIVAYVGLVPKIPVYGLQNGRKGV